MMRSIPAFLITLLTACTFCAPANAAGRPVVIGAALSQSGFLADLAVGMRDALLLWQEEVNAAGGLLGRPVDLKLYDDASDSLRSTALYELLVRDDGAEVLIGPFGSAATSIAAAVAERNRRVMVNASGTSPGIHKRAYRYVFQVPPPSDRAAAGVPALAALAGLKSAVVVARDEATAQAMAEQLAAENARLGGRLELRPSMFYVVDVMKGLAPFSARLKATGVDVVLAPAGAQELADLVRGFKAAGFMPGLLVAPHSLDPAFIKLVGMDAEYSTGLSFYEPRGATPGNAAFVKAYRDKYKRYPDFHAACGWAAGKVLEAAVAKAGSFDQEQLRAAFAALETGTVLGGYKVAADGSQLAATPLVAQILKGRREVVWPDAFRSAAPVLPAPAWAARMVKP